MEIQVIVSLSDRLFALLEDKLPNLGRRVEKAITKELGAQARNDSNIAISVNTDAAESDKPKSSKRAKAEKVEVVEAVVKEAPVEETPATPAAQTQPKKTQGEIIREIIHRTRQRLEGEDYLDNADSEPYKKYHRALTSQFKQIAVTLGYEKPSLIDNDEKIEAFAKECDGLYINDEGLIATPAAPF